MSPLRLIFLLLLSITLIFAWTPSKKPRAGSRGGPRGRGGAGWTNQGDDPHFSRPKFHGILQSDGPMADEECKRGCNSVWYWAYQKLG